MLSKDAVRIRSFGDEWSWNDQWLLVVLRVPEDHRTFRSRMRTRLERAGFGSIGAGLWVTPHTDREGEIRVPCDSDGAVEILTFTAQLGGFGDPRAIVAGAWELGTVAAEYESFVREFGRQRPKTPKAVFRAYTTLVHEWRKFPFLDPDLPIDLLPSAWPRSLAREVFRKRRDAWRQIAHDYFRSLDAAP